MGHVIIISCGAQLFVESSAYLQTPTVTMLSWSWVLLTLTTLVSVHQVTCARGHRAARLSSIWDIILPPKQSSQPISDIQTNKINTQEKHKITVQGCKNKFPNYTEQRFRNHFRFAASKLKSKPKSVQRERTQSTSTAKSLVQISSSDEGKRKLLLNLMDVYQCPTRGVFPIDGDCERFLMCRNDKRVEGRIKGKIYRCPKGIVHVDDQDADPLLVLQATCSPQWELAVSPRTVLLVTDLIPFTLSWDTPMPGETSCYCHRSF